MSVIVLLGVCGWQKIASVWFSVRFQFYEINSGFGLFSVRVLHFSVDAIFHLCLYGMTLEMIYFHTEVIQLIVCEK